MHALFIGHKDGSSMSSTSGSSSVVKNLSHCSIIPKSRLGCWLGKWGSSWADLTGDVVGLVSIAVRMMARKNEYMIGRWESICQLYLADSESFTNQQPFRVIMMDSSLRWNHCRFAKNDN